MGRIAGVGSSTFGFEYSERIVNRVRIGSGLSEIRYLDDSGLVRLNGPFRRKKPERDQNGDCEQQELRKLHRGIGFQPMIHLLEADATTNRSQTDVTGIHNRLTSYPP